MECLDSRAPGSEWATKWAKAGAAASIAGGNNPGFGFGTGNARGVGQSPAARRNPGFFRRFCLGLTDPSGPIANTRTGKVLSAIDDLQRQINALKDSTSK